MRPLCTYDIKTPQTKLNTPLMFMPWDVIYYHGGYREIVFYKAVWDLNITQIYYYIMVLYIVLESLF